MRNIQGSLRVASFWTMAVCLVAAGWAAADAVVVDTLEDLSDGDTSSISALIASPGADGHISLREAIEATNVTPGADEITFSVSGTIILHNTPLCVQDLSGGTLLDGCGAINLQPDDPSQWPYAPEKLIIESSKNVVQGLSFDSFDEAVVISGADAYDNVIRGCSFDVTLGATPITYTGVCITGCASNNLIGGTDPESRNYFMRCDTGVEVIGECSDENRIEGNYFGVGADNIGDYLQAVYTAIRIFSGDINYVGGTAPGAGNFINASGFGIALSSSQGVIVQGNSIGLDVDGHSVIPSNIFAGIFIYYSSGNIIGGAAAGAGNIIAGSNAWCAAIHIEDSRGESHDNIVQGNLLGTDITGTISLGKLCGIVLGETAHDNLIGGSAPGEGNIIASGEPAGIMFGDNYFSVAYPVYGNVIQGNHIGVDVTGTKALPNAIGIWLGANATENIIGGTTPGSANVISGNTGYGIAMSVEEGKTPPSGNIVQGNLIGVDASGAQPLPNGGGLYLAAGAHENQIGGEEAGAGNIIAHNAGTGIEITGAATLGNQIQRNSLHDNTGRGIVLLDGAQGGIGSPEITQLSPLQGVAPAGSVVEIFADDDDEGRIYLDTVMASETGEFSSTVDLDAYPNMNVLATATDAAGNTSEFGGYGIGEGEACRHRWHRGDSNENGRISLSELLRLIQFYNSGGFACPASGAATEDGYAPGPGADQDCCPHDGDYSGGGPDWQINLSELLRFIQFFNSPGYALCEEGEDGFCIMTG